MLTYSGVPVGKILDHDIENLKNKDNFLERIQIYNYFKFVEMRINAYSKGSLNVHIVHTPKTKLWASHPSQIQAFFKE